jgi:hypothetical protein
MDVSHSTIRLTVLLRAVVLAAWAAASNTREGPLSVGPVSGMGGFAHCVSSSSPSTELILPYSDRFLPVSRSIGSKHPTRPLAVVFPDSSKSVVDTVTCAYRSNIPMTVRNGGHSFQGASTQDGHLIIDLSRSCSRLPAVNRTDMTLTLSGGCLHADIIAALYVNNVTDHFAITGGMPLVGYIGWATGGGFGNVTPYVGIGCDQFLSLDLVLYNGTMITVTRSKHEDLFRMLCGGGVGLGVVTEATIRLTPHPDWGSTGLSSPKYTRIILSYPRWALPRALHRLQALLSQGPGSRLGGHGPTITRFAGNDSTAHFCLLYLGSTSKAVSFLSNHGLLSPDLFPRRGIFPIASPAFPRTPPQLAISNYSPSIRTTLTLLANYPHANIITAEVNGYPEAMAPMLLVDDRAMNQTHMCNVLRGLGGTCR